MPIFPESDTAQRTEPRLSLSLSLGETELGWIGVVHCEDRLARVLFDFSSQSELLTALHAEGNTNLDTDATSHSLLSRLQAFIAGEADDFLDVELDTPTTPKFTGLVVTACREIPPGETRTYAQLAEQAGSPGAARAVGNIMASNRIPLVVPCHRVVGSAGSLGGYSSRGGLDTKRRLLEIEESMSAPSRKPR